MSKYGGLLGCISEAVDFRLSGNCVAPPQKHGGFSVNGKQTQT